MYLVILNVGIGVIYQYVQVSKINPIQKDSMMIIQTYVHVYTQISFEPVFSALQSNLQSSKLMTQWLMTAILKCSLRKYCIQHLELVNRYAVSNKIHMFFCNVLIFYRTFSRGALSIEDRGSSQPSAGHEFTSCFIAGLVLLTLQIYMSFFIDHCLFLVFFSSYHCIVCSFFIFGFSIPIQIFLTDHCPELHDPMALTCAT